MRFLFFCVLFLLFLPAKSQEATDSTMLINIDKTLNFYDFEQLRDYIYQNGDRKTYCPNYTDNPHYVMKDLEIYLNPSQGSGAEPQKRDYNVIYIVARGNEIPFNYYLYLTKQRDVYLYDYTKYLTEEPIRSQMLKALDSILLNMKKDMKLIN